METAERLGRGAEFRALREWVREGVDTAIRQADTNAAGDREAAFELPGVVFRSLFADQAMDEFDRAAAWRRLRQEI